MAAVHEGPSVCRGTETAFLGLEYDDSEVITQERLSGLTARFGERNLVQVGSFDKYTVISYDKWFISRHLVGFFGISTVRDYTNCDQSYGE